MHEYWSKSEDLACFVDQFRAGRGGQLEKVSGKERCAVVSLATRLPPKQHETASLPNTLNSAFAAYRIASLFHRTPTLTLPTSFACCRIVLLNY